jgi:hypothetical protein
LNGSHGKGPWHDRSGPYQRPGPERPSLAGGSCASPFSPERCNPYGESASGPICRVRGRESAEFRHFVFVATGQRFAPTPSGDYLRLSQDGGGINLRFVRKKISVGTCPVSGIFASVSARLPQQAQARLGNPGAENSSAVGGEHPRAAEERPNERKASPERCGGDDPRRGREVRRSGFRRVAGWWR